MFRFTICINSREESGGPLRITGQIVKSRASFDSFLRKRSGALGDMKSIRKKDKVFRMNCISASSTAIFSVIRGKFCHRLYATSSLVEGVVFSPAVNHLLLRHGISAETATSSIQATGKKTSEFLVFLKLQIHTNFSISKRSKGSVAQGRRFGVYFEPICF